MDERYVFAYIFLSFSIGLACLGVTLVLARRKDDTLARAFLVFYVALSVLVGSRLLVVLARALASAPDAPVPFALEYMEAFVGRYGVMLAAPYFAHRVFGVSDRRRDRAILVIVLVAAVAQHFTEFGPSKTWDDRGDVAEDVLNAAIMGYIFWVGFSRVNSTSVDRRLAVRLLAVFSISIPGIVFDLFFSDATPLRFYPLSYCVISVVVTWTLVQRRNVPASIPANADWGLSSRESEVLRLVQAGLSNKEIGARLHISPNTVKTHLRAVFEKTATHSRFELISLGAAQPKKVGDVVDDLR